MPASTRRSRVLHHGRRDVRPSSGA